MIRSMIIALALLPLACTPAVPETYGSTPTYQVYFSPKGGCEAHVADLITSSKTKIRILAYSFTSKPIRDALINKEHPAAGNPIDIGVILDRSDVINPSVLPDLIAAGIPVWTDSMHAIAHNKVVLSDDLTTETGSFNYTNQAERSNAENCLFVKNKTLAAEYNTNWESHKSHSQQVSPAPVHAPAPAP